jgi:hypothetical protein
MSKILSDRLNLTDKKEKQASIPMPDFPDILKHSPTLWKKTEVLCSNGPIISNPNGKSSFAPGCPFTQSSNMVPIGGVQYVMEQLFGVQGEIDIPTLYDLTDSSNTTISHPTKYEKPVGPVNSVPATDTYQTPDGTKTVIYRPGHLVQLFGIGITGTAENDITVFPVNYRENSIDSTIASEDGQTIKGTMVPFRYTSTQLKQTDERKQYFGKVKNDDGIISYYLKKFESDPVIKHVWKIGEDTEIEDEENIVSSEDIWQNTSSLNAVESFTEIFLKISKKDTKEWFGALNQEDRARVNTIALFSGRYITTGTLDTDGDYQDVRLFSKLNIPVEYLTLSKDLNIIYRVYGA